MSDSKKSSDEKVFCRGNKMVYELKGDFFHCPFPLENLGHLEPGTPEMEGTVLALGRNKAKEMKMI